MNPYEKWDAFIAEKTCTPDSFGVYDLRQYEIGSVLPDEYGVQRIYYHEGEYAGVKWYGPAPSDDPELEWVLADGKMWNNRGEVKP